ncbi:MAG TPA: hypothetical protein VF855_03815 [Acidimicrobiales bacterium]
MSAATDTIPVDNIVVLPWPDPTDDTPMVDPRSPYVEQCWLPILGPSTVWLLRRFAEGFDRSPTGFELDIPATARSLGLAHDGKHSPFARTLGRCVSFGMATPHSYGLMVRRLVPTVSPKQLARLPEAVQDAHRAWVEAEADERTWTRARVLARSLLGAGEAPGVVERDLQLVGMPASLVVPAVRWALKERDRIESLGAA